MVLVMGSLREEMGRRPRYWRRLLQVLLDALGGKDTPPLIVQVGAPLHFAESL